MFVVGEDEAGSRLDLALASASGASRAQVRRWIEAGRVRINSRAGRPAQRVRIGDRLEADPPQPISPAALPEPIPIHVMYEDADLIVVDKPAGLVVHPAPGHPRGTLVNALLHHCRDLAGVGGILRPGIVHRLDRGTSGVMVIAKRDEAHHALAGQFHEHTKRWCAVYRAPTRVGSTVPSGAIRGIASACRFEPDRDARRTPRGGSTSAFRARESVG